MLIDRIHMLSARGLALTALLFAVPGACSVSHEGPQDGTETGNPPVINDKLISLVVRTDAVHVTGGPGAVTPGGAALEVVSSFSGETFRANAAADGSFDIAVTTALLDTFEVRAVDGAKSSNAVYVVRGAAAVTSGATDKLSCDQRTQLAQKQLTAIADSANRACTTSADCLSVWAGSSCTGGCPQYELTKQGESEINAARTAIEGGLCKSFAADGCRIIIPPCAPPVGTISCVANVCTRVEASAGSPDCSSDFDPGVGDANAAVYWFSKTAQACLARLASGTSNNGNHYASLTECESACKPAALQCPAGRVERDVCLAGGLAGGCARQGRACVKACTAVSDCTLDPVGSWCAGGFCDATSPF